MSICEKCNCGKYKIPFFLEEYIGGIMEHPDFCKCEESEEEKENRHNKEFKQLQIILSKQKIRKITNNENTFRN